MKSTLTHIVICYNSYLLTCGAVACFILVATGYTIVRVKRVYIERPVSEVGRPLYCISLKRQALTKPVASATRVDTQGQRWIQPALSSAAWDWVNGVNGWHLLYWLTTAHQCTLPPIYTALRAGALLHVKCLAAWPLYLWDNQQLECLLTYFHKLNSGWRV